MCFEISGLVQANEMRTTFIQKVLEAFDGKESLVITSDNMTFPYFSLPAIAW